MVQALRAHWPEYLIEAWGLGMFMISAGLFTTLIEYPGSPVSQAIADPGLRRALIGLMMGLTAITIIYSPWGRRSGAHLNPAVTLSFLILGKVARWDAVFFIVAQFLGGLLGVLLVVLFIGAPFVEPPVVYVVTVPGRGGPAIAFAAEFMISLGMMLTVLTVSNSPRFAHLTGVFAGVLVATYITFEAPLSGMSINPARSFASATAGGIWTYAWVYYSAPILGMLSAVAVYRWLSPRRGVHCAKLDHPAHVRCIHCGYEPPQAGS